LEIFIEKPLTFVAIYVF